jgi:serine/threonine-protein kinase
VHQSTIAIALTLFFSIIIVGIVLARSNIRSGQGDRRGAARLALLAFLSTWFSLFCQAHHIPAALEFATFLTTTAWASLAGAFAWLLYVALEPHARRRWPRSLISWSRLLEGHMRAPVVGRDLVVGLVVGLFLTVAGRVEHMFPRWTGGLPFRPETADYQELLGIWMMIAGILWGIMFGIAVSLILFFIFFLFRLVLRRDWLSGLVTTLLLSLLYVDKDHPILSATYALLFLGIPLVVLIRFGLLALVVAICTQNILETYPLTAHLTAWYAEPTFFVFSLFLAASIFGFYTSTAGKQRFGGLSLDN